MSPRDLDEDDVRVRASRRGSRPRTKERPAHTDALVGMVIGVDRGRYTVLLPRGSGGRKQPERVVVAMKAREIGRTRVVVGDDVVGQTDLRRSLGTLRSLLAPGGTLLMLEVAGPDALPYRAGIGVASPEWAQRSAPFPPSGNSHAKSLCDAFTSGRRTGISSCRHSLR